MLLCVPIPYVKAISFFFIIIVVIFFSTFERNNRKLCFCFFYIHMSTHMNVYVVQTVLFCCCIEAMAVNKKTYL